MSENIDRITGASGDPGLGVGVRVRVHQGRSTETAGTVVEEIGDTVGVPMDIGDTHISDPAG